MPMAFKIRSSKFRHVYGSPARKEQCYENIRITRNTHDSNFCAVNPKFIAVVTESGGGGSFVCFPLKNTGRVDPNAPKVCGHAGVVMDIKWSPFSDHIIASSSEDCSVKVWQIPEEGLHKNLTEWQVDLHGHQRRVGYIEWHPTAENVLLSAGFDYKCILWNVEQAEPINIINCHTDTIYSLSWNRDGSLFTTTSKDKVLRVIDPRQASVATQSTLGADQSNRTWKSVYLGDTGKIFTCYFKGERMYAIWDVRSMSRPLVRNPIDSSCGIILPYYDHDSRMMYLAGKGDSCVKYFEITDEHPYCHFLNIYQSPYPQRGFGVMPKRGCDTTRCEVMRFYKLYASKDLVEPISMIAPRKTGNFHSDLFCPTNSKIPSLSADEWVSGQTRDPILISMLDGHVTNSPKSLPAKAVQIQDSALTQAPTITTYKAMNKPNAEGKVTMKSNSIESSAPLTNHAALPASLRNIKQLSTNQDIITLNDNTDNKGAGDRPTSLQNNNNPKETIQSPTAVQQGVKKVWTPTSPTSPNTNGFSGNDSDQRSSDAQNDLRPAPLSPDFFKPYLISPKPETSPTVNSQLESINDPSQSQRKLHETSKDEDCHTVTHVKKVWSVPQTPVSPIQWHEGLPQNEAELRKAYFKQLEEIHSLKEQIALKDKRIRQLEEELTIMKLPQKDTGPGQSEC